MPAPAVYILAFVGTIAAGIAFKEFIYEPHLAPKIERWAEEFIARRQARRNQRAGPIPVPASNRGHDGDFSMRSKRSDSGDDDEDQIRQSIELENLIAKEVREWRSEVDQSQPRGLRHRTNASASGSRRALDESFVPMSPTHILFDNSVLASPTSSNLSGSKRLSSLSGLQDPTSKSIPRSPQRNPGKLPTPDSTLLSSPSSPRSVLRSPTHIPSLSQTYPLDLDHEHGIELLSAPSSRPDSPFSSFSRPASAQSTAQSDSNYHSLSSPNAMSPLVQSPAPPTSDLDFLSDFDEREATSPRFSETSLDDAYLADEVRSELSDLSWTSGGARSH